MKNAVYLQSGGPTAVINSSFYGVIKSYQENQGIDVLYGSRFGLQGLIEDNLIEINKEKDYSSLTKIPGAILGSARLRLKDEFDPLLDQILEVVKKHDIHYIYCNGGNDSMDTGDKLTKFFKRVNYPCTVVGICKTIDNDLCENDFSPGFASAVNYIVKSTMEIALDLKAYKKGRVTIVETMGRDAGWLAASSSLANRYNLGPDLIYVPECSFKKEEFLEDIKRIYQEKGKVFIVVSEALKDENGEYLFADTNNLDSFGHIQLGSISMKLCDLVKHELGINTRHIEYNLMQRCASHIASQNDITWAFSCGYNAVKFSLENKVGVVSIKKKEEVTYQLVPFEKVANHIRHMPRNYMNERGNFVSQKGEEYFKTFIDDSLKIDIPEEFR